MNIGLIYRLDVLRNGGLNREILFFYSLTKKGKSPLHRVRTFSFFISIEKIILILPAKFQVSDKQIWQQKIPDRKLLRLRLYIRSHNLVPELHRLQ